MLADVPPAWRKALYHAKCREEDRRESEYLSEMGRLTKEHARGLTTPIEFAERVEKATTAFLQDAARFSVRV